MFKPAQYVSEFVSLTVVILMAVAVVAGQVSASIEGASAATEFHQAIEDRFNIDFEGRLGAKAVMITIGVVSDLGQFRGENE